MILKILIVLALFLSPVFVQAQPLQTTFNLASYHLSRRNELGQNGCLNEFNPGVGLKSTNYEFGGYLNSRDRLSFYAVGILEWRYGLSLFGGGVTGYAKYDILPFVGAALTVKKFRILLVPSVTTTNHLVSVLSFGFVY